MNERRKAIYTQRKLKHPPATSLAWSTSVEYTETIVRGWIHGFYQGTSGDEDAGPCAVFETQNGTIMKLQTCERLKFEEWGDECGGVNDKVHT